MWKTRDNNFFRKITVRFLKCCCCVWGSKLHITLSRRQWFHSFLSSRSHRFGVEAQGSCRSVCNSLCVWRSEPHTQVGESLRCKQPVITFMLWFGATSVLVSWELWHQTGAAHSAALCACEECWHPMTIQLSTSNGCFSMVLICELSV